MNIEPLSLMTAKEQSELLMNQLLPLAKKMLQRYGEFYPYGGFLKRDGSIVELGAEDRSTEYPKSTDLIRTLRDRLKEAASREECLAAAIIFNVEIPSRDSAKSVAAIQINVEHVDGYSAEVFLPYQVHDHLVEYGEMFAQVGDRRIFVDA